MFTFGIEGILFAVLAFAGLIFIHELGHFIGARLVGIGVEAFALGFGPAIFKFHWRGVEYRLNWIPVGGYCKLKGQEDFGKDDPSEDTDDFHNRPAWARLVTMGAGPLFNLIIGVVLFALFLLANGNGSFLGMQQPLYYDTTIAVHQTMLDHNPDFPFRTGDRILAVNGYDTETNLDVIRNLFYYIEEPCVFTIDRDGTIQDINYTPTMGFLNPGWRSYFTFSRDIGFVIDDRSNNYEDTAIPSDVKLPSENAAVYKGEEFIGNGLLPGDRIIGTANGQKIITVKDLHWVINEVQQISHPYDAIANGLRLATTVKEHTTSPITFIIERDGTSYTAEMTPKYIRLENGYLMGPIIGVGQKTRSPDEPYSYNIFEALYYGAQDGWYYLVMNIKLARLMFTGHVSAADSLAGPVGIFSTLVTLGERSPFVTFLWWVALISLLLGFFNLLPIPALDGGHILVTVLEMIRRKRFQVETIYRIQMIGFSILIGIMIFATFNDIRRLIFG